MQYMKISSVRLEQDQLTGSENTTLKESVEQQKQREQIEKQIAALETKMKKEKQWYSEDGAEGGDKRVKSLL